jgi:hypothetical protein
MDIEKEIKESAKVAIGLGVFSSLAVVILGIILNVLH